MPKLPIIKTRELIRAVGKIGFIKFHQVGSHAQFKNSDGKRITIPIHQGRDMDKKILRGIIDDTELSVEEFLVLLKK